MAIFSSVLKNVILCIFIFFMLKPVFSSLKNSFIDFAESKTKVGVLSISGAIMNSSCTVKRLHLLCKDPKIKAIVIKMDSPGGAAGSSQAIYEEIIYCKKKYTKPIITSIENICASGGYYVASATDHIIATPSAFIGSIGVYVAYPELKECINQFKAYYHITQVGEYKTIGNPLAGKLTHRQQELLTSVTQDTYNQFIQDVTHARPQLKLAQEKEWADGKIFTGRQALALKLIDELGSFSAVEEAVKKYAVISNEIVWVKEAKRMGIFSSIFGCEEDDLDGYEANSFLYACIVQVMNFLGQQGHKGIQT